MEDAVDVLMDFLECAVHTVLHTRQIYPSHIFEQRMKYGVNVWQCKHADVCTYIRRVLTNCRVLLVQGVMDCLIFSTLRESLHDVNSSANSNFNNNNSNQSNKGSSSSSSSSSSQSSGGNNGYDTHPSSSSRQQNKIIDQISISTKINKFHDITAKEGDNMHYYELEEELRSSILNLSLLDVKMKKLRDDATWTLMVTTGDHREQRQVDALQSLILSGDWIVENALFPEKIAVSKTAKTSEKNVNLPISKNGFQDLSFPTPSPSPHSSQQETQNRPQMHSQPQIIPIKSFENELFNLNVRYGTENR